MAMDKVKYFGLNALMQKAISTAAVPRDFGGRK